MTSFPDFATLPFDIAEASPSPPSNTEPWATAEGIAVVLTSDTLEETTGLSHNILVMRDGVVTHRADASPGRKPQQVELIRHMV